MPDIRRCELPPGALLERYRHAGAYADCYATDVRLRVSHAAYIEAFYTTPLFRVERAILARCVAKPSSDAEAGELARGQREAFAAWTVEARSADQLLLCDFRKRTRSWLMVGPAQDATTPGGAGTRLYFGSAVVPVANARTGGKSLGVAFAVLLGFHKLYSRALLASAASKLAQAGEAGK